MVGRMDRSRVALGEWGESRVARHYEAAGYEVLDRNWRVRGGEIDLVLGRGDEIVFCEVKTRMSSRYGHGVEAVGVRKQQFLRRTAVTWLDAHDRRGRLRFDVVAVTRGRIEVVEAAF
jgi:putative endonuclease